MSTLIREAKYLRILTPRTTNGINPIFDEFGRQKYKESNARLSALKNFVTLNKRRTEALKYKIEIVDNPDYIPRRRDQISKNPRNKNPRPASEKNITMQNIDINALKEQIRAEMMKENESKIENKIPEHAMQYKPAPVMQTDIPEFSDEEETETTGVDAEETPEQARARKDARNERDRIRREEKKLQKR